MKTKTLYHRMRRSLVDRFLAADPDGIDGALGADLAGLVLTEQPPTRRSRLEPQGEGPAAGVVDTVLLSIEGFPEEGLRGYEAVESPDDGRSWIVPAAVVRSRATIRVVGEREPDLERVRERSEREASG